MARYFGLPEATIVTITALAGAIILFTVIFKFIPIAQRFTFILAGLFGGIAGYLLWFGGLGEMIMP